ADLCRSRVMRVVEQTPRERILRDGPLVAHDSRDEAADGVYHEHCRKLAAAHHEIAQRQFFAAHEHRNPFIHPLISAAEQHDMREPTQPEGIGLRKPTALWREQDYSIWYPSPLADSLHRSNERLGLHDHSRPTAVRHVVDTTVTIGRV